MNTPVLAIDDDKAMCDLLQVGLRNHNFEVEVRQTGEAALALAAERDFAAVITDLKLNRQSGLDVCRQVHERDPDLPVLVITGFGDMQSAIDAIRAGAYDFINKPVDMRALAHALDRAVQHRQLRDQVKRLTSELEQAKGAGALVGNSSQMRRLYHLITRLRDTDASVLITGESGTGKELVAKALHSESPRANEPFVAINCAAVPSSLLESELFGHVKGAFTDARSSRRGLFEQANRGTVLLDEVGEMPLEVQPKLLRVLQERKVRPVGGSADVPFDVRIITATNRDLEREVEHGRFREDLYYRLNVVQLHVPPLRARGNDILLLAQHFVERTALRTNKPVHGICADAARKLLEFDWPGNVRQLQNSIERAVALTRFEQIKVEDLPERVRRHHSTNVEVGEMDADHMPTLEELERRYIERVLSTTGGNKTLAARVLGVDRRTLYRKLERYDRIEET